MSQTDAPPKATLANVAARARVSMATASKVANGRPDVALVTRERVERAIHDLGYEPPKRRFDSSKPSIVFLADVINSTYAMEILRGAMEAAEEHDIDLVVERTHRSSQAGTRSNSAALTQRLLSANRMGAVVLTAGIGGALYADVLSARLPMVVIDPLDSSHPDVISIGATNWLGGRSAAEHLLELGHANVAVLAGPSQSLSAIARLDGFLSAWKSAGLGSAPLVHQIRFDPAEARQVALDWLSDPQTSPTAIATGSDSQAMGVLQAARELGVKVPAQLSVISYDDTALASLATPPLTAVHQPLMAMGRRAIETVIQVHEMGRPDAKHLEIATSLVIRESTGRPPE